MMTATALHGKRHAHEMIRRDVRPGRRQARFEQSEHRVRVGYIAEQKVQRERARDILKAAYQAPPARRTIAQRIRAMFSGRRGA